MEEEECGVDDRTDGVIDKEIPIVTCKFWDDTWITNRIAEILAEDKHDEGNETSGSESFDESLNTRSNELKRPLDDSPSSGDENCPKRACKHDHAKKMNMMINSSFNPLLHIFKHLCINELLRASQVCKIWKFIASHPSFWKTVIIKNLKVRDWAAFIRYISIAKTKHLSLKKMICPSAEDSEIIMWEKFCIAISSCSNELMTVDMGRCTSKAFLAMAEASPQLKSLVSTAIIASEIDLLLLKSNTMLEELKLKPLKSCLQITNYSFLTSLVNLTTLSLKSINNLNMIAGHIPETLKALELGECNGMTIEVVMNIERLKLLQRLRLEKGFLNCPTTALLRAISTLSKLHHLELINFEIKPGFDQALSKCSNIKFLLLIPTYFTEMALTNSVLLTGLSFLRETLTSVIWVITLELLRTIDLYMEQCENSKSWIRGRIPPREERNPFSCIPVIRRSIEGTDEVDILKFSELFVLFHELLPHTRIRIRRVVYDHTWNQTFS